MTNSAGLYTFAPINTRLLANGMVHRSLAPNVVTMKLRNLGLKRSGVNVFWELVAMCLYQPTGVHDLRGLSSLSPASVKMAHAGTVTFGLPRSIPRRASDADNVDFAGHHHCGPRPPNEDGDLQIAVATALPPGGLLESVLLSLKEGEILSDSMVRRLRRKDVEAKAATAQGRAPVSDSQRRKQKKKAAAALRAPSETSSDHEALFLAEHERASARSRPQQGSLHLRETPPFTISIDAALLNVERRKVTAEDVERLAASVSRHRRLDFQ
ncbi:hypothetical protein BDN67DRAFT_968882 [Paxillus ammoniavirescens]|nr:hypothetical protein BDN67DRAFT_968882 [Paxillus ammoniavirescens]